VLRRIFGLKRDEIIGLWRKLHNEKLHNMYSSPNIIIIIKSRRIKCVGHVACMGERRNGYSVSVGKPGGRPLGRPEPRWVYMYNIKWALEK
jgi:hypothetical protein